MKQIVFRMLLVAALFCGGMASPAVACPMCKQANETSDALPRAYMYSIFFMMGTPAMIFVGFGLTFYRLSKKQAELQQEQTDSME